MSLQKFPNRNGRLERRWYGEITRRWAKAWKRIMALEIPRMVTNLAASEEQLVDFYIQQVQTIVDEEILPGSWQDRYLNQGYQQAMDTATRELLSGITGTEAAAVLAGLATDPNFSELHRNELAFLIDRAGQKLDDALHLFLGSLPTLIRDNIGQPLPLIVERMKESWRKSIISARRIATTELNQAAQRAALVRAKEYEESHGVDTAVRWVTANDSRVRHLHATWHGQIMTREKALQNMQVSPWNCRCHLRPVVEDRVPARQNAKFAKERKRLLQLEEK